MPKATSLEKLDDPNPDVRMDAADAIIHARAPKPALAKIARWMDDPDQPHWLWMMGVSAVLVSETPSKAFTKIAPKLADKKFAERVLQALQEHKGEIDARFFEAAAQWLPDGPSKPSAQYFLEEHGQRDEVQAVLVRAAEKLAAGKAEPKWGYFYQMLREIGVPDSLPAMLKIVARTSKKHVDWRFTAPLNVVVELGDAKAVPALQALVETVKKPAAKSALAAAIAKLDKSKKKKSSKSSKSPLVAAGLSEERAATIEAIVRNQIDLAPKRAAKPAVGTTRFGGEPDLPAGTAWPHVECTKKNFVMSLDFYPAGTFPMPDKRGRMTVPLAFVAQIDLADLAKHDEDGLLPKVGMLWFFARQEVIVGEHRDLQKMASHVVYAQTKGKLVRTSPPETLVEREHYKPAAVTISHARRLPPSSVEPMSKLGLIASERDAYEAATRNQNWGQTHAVLGWANATYFRGVPTAKEQLLLRVGSDGVSGFEWGDAAPIFFCVDTKALAKADFAKVFCLHDE